MSNPADGTREQTPDDVARMLAPGATTSPTPAFAAGDAVPGLSSWLLERPLGGGGFGAVWLTRHAWNAKEKPRAVKFCTDPAARHRLVTHERNVVLRVMKYAGDHPNVVPLLDCNLDGDTPWLMYEFVEGGTLADTIEQWRELPMGRRLGRAVRVLYAVASALAKFHRFAPPLVHRDMKPHNVLMAGAVPRITDFGIGSVVMPAKDGGPTGVLTAFAARLPSALHAAGTRSYAPPEQLFGSPPHPRDDVYALGIIAYQMVMADLKASPGPDATLELRDLKVPSELVTLIVKSVAFNADRRPPDAGEWETALAAVIEKAQKQAATTDPGSVEAKAAPLPPPPAEPTERSAGRTVRPVPPPRPSNPPALAPTAPPVAAAPPRPTWVYVVFTLYFALILMMFGIMVAVGTGRNSGGIVFGAGIAAAVLLAAAGVALVITRIGRRWQRASSRKPITRPLLVSASCAALLFLGAASAALETFSSPKDGSEIMNAALVGVGVVWVVWVVVFWRMSWTLDQQSWSDRAYRYVLAGSVVELLVAIPMHLVVRRRGECCAGMLTSFGIGVGMVVMAVTLGPGLFFLFARRYKQAYAKKPPKNPPGG